MAWLQTDGDDGVTNWFRSFEFPFVGACSVTVSTVKPLHAAVLDVGQRTALTRERERDLVSVANDNSGSRQLLTSMGRVTRNELVGNGTPFTHKKADTGL
jgi:hypothetical protein